MSNDKPQLNGHTPTLLACFLQFDLSFMLWVMLGALGVFIAESLKLNASQKALLVAIPILSGSLLRIPLGLLSDRIGGKIVASGILVFLFIPLSIGYFSGESLSALIAAGLMLGVAGASFAVALPLASRWYPPEKQGLAMGIAAAGNSGTIITNLLAPRLATAYGWHNVFLLAMIPLVVVLIAFVLMAKESPNQTKGQPFSKYLKIMKTADLWWFCLLYSVTFGGFVGLSSFLPLFFRDQYHVTPIQAGYITALVAFVGSGIRPIGGWLADKVGGVKLLSFVLFGVSFAYLFASLLLGLNVMVPILMAGMACLGIGNGAIFQIVPQRFREEIGLATGVVGAIGGVGGFLLPMLLGNFKQMFGTFASGFVVLGSIALTAAIVIRVLVAIQQGWKFSWKQPTPQTSEV